MFTAISDHTDHKASAVFASIEPILLKYYQANVHHFNIISESPTSQYRNKNVFWFMCKFYSLKNVSIDWIYLKAGKGKGAADGIGAVVKRAFTDIILQHPDTDVRMEMRELPNMLAKEFSVKTLQKYNKGTTQNDNDDENYESVNDDDDESNNVEIQVGDYVMVIHEPFRGYFAVVTDKSYGDEFEIQYFQKKEK